MVTGEGEDISVSEVTKKISVVKLLSGNPECLNVVGRVLHELPKSSSQTPLPTLRESKLTLFLHESLNLKTHIKVVIEIDPAKQELKTIVNLFKFCDYFGTKMVLRKVNKG